MIDADMNVLKPAIFPPCYIRLSMFSPSFFSVKGSPLFLEEGSSHGLLR